MDNGGKFITAVHVTESNDHTVSIRFEYLHHQSHVFQQPNIQVAYQWASSALFRLREDVVLNLFMDATEHGEASLMQCAFCPESSFKCQKDSEGRYYCS